MKSAFNIMVGVCLTGIFLLPGPALALSGGKAIEGLELYRKQEFDKAQKKFIEAKEDKPDDPKLSYNLGNSRYKLGNFGDALQDYARSIEKKSDPALKQKSIYNMGNVYFRQNKLEKSAAAYKKALEMDPNDMDAKFNLEFVREQIQKKKQEEQQKQDQQGDDKKNQESGEDQKDQAKKQDSQDDQNGGKDNQRPSSSNQQEQEQSGHPSSRHAEAVPEGMTEEQAEQRLGSLTEDLKKFQRKQALSMEFLFNYQGNDW